MSITSLPFPRLNKDVTAPMNVDAMISSLVKMTPQQRQAFAQANMNDPISLSAVKYVDNQIKDQAQRMTQPQPMPPVNQGVAQSVGMPTPPSQPMMTASPEAQQQPAMPQQPPQQQPPQPVHAASGGLMLPENSGIAQLPVKMNLAGGGIAGYDDGGVTEYGNEAKRAPTDFGAALVAEGITDPHQQAFLRAIYGQESGSGKNTKTSNRGAVGGMQITPPTFAGVADPGMDINNPFDNARAGIRYAMQGYNKAEGAPELAGAYYYGGPSGLKKAKQGIAVGDKKNPNAPTTIDYGKDIARRMTALLPIGSAQAETLPSNDQSSAETSRLLQQAGAPDEYKSAVGKGMGKNISSTLGKIFSAANPETAGYSGEAALPPELVQAQNADRSARDAAVPNSPVQNPVSEAGISNTTSAGGPLDALYRNKYLGSPEDQNPAETARLQRQNAQTPEALTPKQTAAVAEKAKEDPSSLSSREWLALAAGLLGNDSPYASKAFSSGLAALQAQRQYGEKAALEKSKNEAEVEYYKQHARHMGAQADALPAKEDYWRAQAEAKLGGLFNTQAGTQARLLATQLVTANKALSTAFTPERQMEAQKEVNRINAAIDNLNSQMRGANQAAPTSAAPVPGFTVTKVQ